MKCLEEMSGSNYENNYQYVKSDNQGGQLKS
jgi:hypothetical protein